MGHERIQHLKNTLLCCIEAQMIDLEDVDTAELGAAIDMLKDLEEALYYCTITEAMKEEHEMEDEEEEHWGREHRHMSNYSEFMPRSPHEGRSPGARKSYLENKAMGKDKTALIKELEHYMQELSSDIVEMIQEADVEEKTYLEKKLLALASKIGQMK